MKSSNIGGQAVIEGIMMKNRDSYSVAVRKSNGEIEVQTSEYKSIASKSKWFRLPFIRGCFGFVDSMVLGMRTLTFSAGFFEDEEEEASGGAPSKAEVSEGKAGGVLTGLIMAVSMVLAVGLFMILPMFIANVLSSVIGTGFLSLLEGVIRMLLFVLYIVFISRMKDIRRTFMYHGAEHKCINCIEHGMDLTVKNVSASSKQHKRCGTSFMFYVMFISVLFFMFLKFDTLWLRIISRILLIPVIAGVSYEVIQKAGNSDSFIMNLLSKPGMWLQNLTTLEPDDSMIEVAIKAVEEVYDWRAYQKENYPDKAAVREGEEASFQVSGQRV